MSNKIEAAAGTATATAMMGEGLATAPTRGRKKTTGARRARTTASRASSTKRSPRRSVAKVTRARATKLKFKKIKASDLDWAGMAQQLLNVRTFIDLKQELAEVGKQLTKVDVAASLSPAAQEKMADLDRRYRQVIEGLARTQKTFDRDFDRVLRKLQASKKEATVRLNSIKKASKNIKKSFAK